MNKYRKENRQCSNLKLPQTGVPTEDTKRHPEKGTVFSNKDGKC